MSKASTIAHRRVPLIVLQPVDTPDGVGGLVRTYQMQATVWGAIIPLSASEQFLAQRAEQKISHRIEIRWRPDISAAWQFQSTRGTYLIHSVYDPDQTARHLFCLCEETAR